MADESARPEATETGPPGLTGEQPGAGQQQPGKQNWWIWIVIGVVIIAAAAFFFLSNQAVAVPDVVGMTLEEATAAIEDVGLVVGSVQEVEDSEGLGTPGVVLAQSPEAGAEANEGDAVELEVLGEKEMATVPDIVGLEQAEAEAAITEAGLEPATYEEYDEEVPAGAVYGQAPDPGTKVEPGSKVVVGVSKGPAPASAVVPDVVGQSEADATKAIGDAGLKPEVFRAYDDTVAKGVVTRQSPSASAEVVPGTTVGLLVSEGPAPSQPSAPEQESVQVPAVVGQNEADASRTLTDAGLTPVPYQVYSDDVAKGTVIDQVPGAGATVAPGTEVGIAVSQGPRPEEGVDVPDVTGMSAEEASEAVLAAGLEPVQLEVPNEAEAGTVFAQLPRAGKTVYPNSKVIMLVSTGPGEAALPKEPAEGGDSSE